jgi:hypothetical protein
VETLTAQLLYEIGGVAYAGPDVMTSFDTIELREDGPDRVAISGTRGAPPPATTKVCLNHLGGHRNEMTFVLTGLDIEAKAELARAQLGTAFGGGRPAKVEWTLIGTPRPDPSTQGEATALLRCAVLDPDADKVGRAFSGAAVELALAGYPGFTMTSPPGKGSPYGVYTPAFVPNGEVEHVAVLPDGTRRPIAPAPEEVVPGSGVPRSGAAGSGAAGSAALESGALESVKWERSEPPPAQGGDPNLIVERPGEAAVGETASVDNPMASVVNPVGGAARAQSGRDERTVSRPVVLVPLGRVAGARSGDKGGDANIGVWARTGAQWSWLADYLTVERLTALLPETRELTVTRHLLPNLRAMNFVVEGLLQEGVSASTRFDPQGKALGEWLRSRLVDAPEEIL